MRSISPRSRSRRRPTRRSGRAIEDLALFRERFREEFRERPALAYRDWFRLQEELAERGDAESARLLAVDLWSLIPELAFPSSEERARFLHNVAVFFGNPGPAADLARSRQCFKQALACFSSPDEGGWHARVLHNFATAISNLGQTADELRESVALFERALVWRTAERAIARGVTRHNMGIVLRRLAELDPEHAREHLEASAAAFREAIAIREGHSLAEGHALSLFHLGLTLEAAGQTEETRQAFEAAADAFDRLGKTNSAAVARSHQHQIDAKDLGTGPPTDGN
jgi:tetratricopeptide (TPR) repeat protein